MGIMGLAEVMDRSIEILRKYIKAILLFTVAYAGIEIGVFMAVLIGGGIFAALFAMLAPSPVLAVIFGVLIILLAIAFALTSNVGMIKIAAQEFSGEEVDFSNAIGASLKSFIKVLGITVVATLMFIPLLAVFVGIFYLLDKGFQYSLVSVGIYKAKEIMLIIGVILTILAAIIVTIGYFTFLVFSLHTAVMEKKGVFASIGRSFTLVKGSFWRLFGTLIIIYFIMYALNTSIASFFALMISILYMLLSFLNLGIDYMTFLTVFISIFRWPLNLISILIIAPIGTNMITMLYYNQRFKKEGYDMVVKLREMKKNRERKQSSESVKYN